MLPRTLIDVMGSHLELKSLSQYCELMNTPTVKLSERELRILAAMQLRAADSAEEIARLCEVKVRTVQTLVRKLISEDLVYRRPLVNFSALGFQAGSILLEASGGSDKITEIRRYCEESMFVRVIQQFGSSFTFQIDLVIQDQSEVSSFLSGLSEKFSGYIDRLFYFPMMAFYLLGDRIFDPEVDPGSPVGWTHSLSSYKPDALDFELVSTAIKGESFKTSSLAKQLGQSASTVAYRISRLEQENVITGYYWAVNTTALGFSYFNIFISTNSFSETFARQLFDFSLEDLCVDVFSRFLTNPQFHLGVATRDHGQVLDLVQRLKSAFKQNISTIEVAPTVQVYGAKSFSVKSFELRRAES